MANVIEVLIKAQDLASKEMDKVRSAADRLGDVANKLKPAFAVVGTAAVAAGVASIKMAADLEQSLNIFKSVSGATAEQMALVSAKARELGKDASLPGISARDAANAMTELAKAGISVNDTLSASKGVLSLAKAGQLEVADAAQITAQALNAFKLQGKDAAKVADVLSAGANASAASVESMALGLQQSAAVANQFGVSLNDTVTALAIFANRGIEGSDAGTSLKTMLISLANPSKNAAELMQKMGLKAYDAQGKFVGLRELSIRLKESLKGLTQAQQNQALATIFGTDAFRAAAFLADAAGKSYDDMSIQIGKVGAATELAAAQNSGFNGALDNLRSTLETIGTTIASKALPGLTNLLNGVTNRLPEIADAGADLANSLAEGFTKRLKQIEGIGTILISKLQNGDYQGVGEQIATGLLEGLKSISFRLKAVLKPILDALSNLDWVGIGITIGGKIIPGLVLGLAAGVLNFDFGKLFSGIIAHWSDILLGILAIALAPAKVVAPIAKIFAKIPFAGTFIAALITNINKVGGKVVDLGLSLVKKFIGGFVDGLGLASPVLGPAIANFFRNFFAGVMPFLRNMARFGEQVMEALGRSMAENGPKQIVESLQFMRTILGRVAGSIQDGFMVAFYYVRILVTDFISSLVNGLGSVAEYFGAWGAVIRNGMDAIWGYVKAVAASAWDAVIGYAARAWNGITNIFSGAAGWFRGLWDNIANALSGPANTMRNIFNDVFENIKSTAKNSVNWIIDRVNSMISSVNGVAGKIPGAPKLGNIPRLASGTPSWAGGWTTVGERGIELVNLPKGATVKSNTQSRQMMSNATSPSVVIQNLSVNSKVDVGIVAREIAWQLAVRGA